MEEVCLLKLYDVISVFDTQLRQEIFLGASEIFNVSLIDTGVSWSHHDRNLTNKVSSM